MKNTMPTLLIDQARALWVSMALLGLCLSAPAATSQPGAATQGVHIEFFFQQGCNNCSRVENEILPELESLYGGLYILDKYDTGIMTN